MSRFLTEFHSRNAETLAESNTHLLPVLWHFMSAPPLKSPCILIQECLSSRSGGSFLRPRSLFDFSCQMRMLTPELGRFWIATPSVWTKVLLPHPRSVYWARLTACMYWPWAHYVSQDLQRSWCRCCMTGLSLLVEGQLRSWISSTGWGRHLIQLWPCCPNVSMRFQQAIVRRLGEVHKYCVLQFCLPHMGTYRDSYIHLSCHLSMPNSITNTRSQWHRQTT